MDNEASRCRLEQVKEETKADIRCEWKMISKPEMAQIILGMYMIPFEL